MAFGIWQILLIILICFLVFGGNRLAEGLKEVRRRIMKEAAPKKEKKETSVPVVVSASKAKTKKKTPAAKIKTEKKVPVAKTKKSPTKKKR